MARTLQDNRERAYRKLTGKKRLYKFEREALAVVTAGQLAGRANKDLYNKRIKQAEAKGIVSDTLRSALLYLPYSQAKKVDDYYNKPESSEPDAVSYTFLDINTIWENVSRKVRTWARRNNMYWMYGIRLYDGVSEDFDEYLENPSREGGTSSKDHNTYDYAKLQCEKFQDRMAVVEKKGMHSIRILSLEQGRIALERGDYDDINKYTQNA